MFEAARQQAPSIIFIDEIDAIGAMRSDLDSSHARASLNQLLVELDGFDSQTSSKPPVIVIAATNFPQLLDKALVRPGRFDKHVQISLPDIKGRKDIIDLYTSKITKDNSVSSEIMARGTSGFSGADLANVINCAALKASRDKRKAVTMQDIEWAIDKISMGSERQSAVIPAESKKRTAFHEGGHALMALSTKGAMPIHKATIMPRGQSLGLVKQLPNEDDMLMTTKEQLMARLDVAMGGRVAEELVFGPGEINSGASSDLQQATNTARSIVMRYGMGTKTGIMFMDDNVYKSLGNETKKMVDEEVNSLLDDAYQRTLSLISSKRPQLDALANALVKYETLDAQELARVVQGLPLKRSL